MSNCEWTVLVVLKRKVVGAFQRVACRFHFAGQLFHMLLSCRSVSVEDSMLLKEWEWKKGCAQLGSKAYLLRRPSLNQAEIFGFLSPINSHGESLMLWISLQSKREAFEGLGFYFSF